MAENEYLDASKGLRWRQVAEAICEGLGTEEATGRALDSLLKTLRHASKEIPLSDMIQAIESTSELQRLFEQVRGAEDIKYCLVRASLEGSSPQASLEAFLGLALRSALEGVPLLVNDSDQALSMTEMRKESESIQERAKPALARLAEKLAANPNRIPPLREICRDAPPTKVDTQAMMDKSLLHGPGRKGAQE